MHVLRDVCTVYGLQTWRVALIERAATRPMTRSKTESQRQKKKVVPTFVSHSPPKAQSSVLGETWWEATVVGTLFSAVAPVLLLLSDDSLHGMRDRWLEKPPHRATSTQNANPQTTPSGCPLIHQRPLQDASVVHTLSILALSLPADMNLDSSLSRNGSRTPNAAAMVPITTDLYASKN